MALILNLETATKVCSVSLAKDGVDQITLEINSEKYSHSENINLFIEQVFQKTEFEINMLDAVAISQGPGSYTGLRIGASTAKGIAYALEIPLISVNSLKALAQLCAGIEGYICPMFDARRMEVYSALFDSENKDIKETEAKIIESDSYKEFLDKAKVLFVGPGANKCVDEIKHKNAIFDLDTQVTAKGMIPLSESKFNSNDFEDVAYFEPFYLKDFIAGTPKKLL